MAESASSALRTARADDSAEQEGSTVTTVSSVLVRTREAVSRDGAARLRDANAFARDRVAEARDRLADQDSHNTGSAPESVRRLRARGASDRAGAAADRERAADDRAEAGDDRRQSGVDLRHAQLDDLTGAYKRGLGLLTLRHEIARAHRTHQPFVLAFIDVDWLKQVNDGKGHAAGDALLRSVVTEIGSNLRSYDPIVRMGGDEFVCAFSNTGLDAAAGRVKEIKGALKEQPDSSISVGLAELRPGENLEDLTARGDAELYRAKHRT